MLLSFFTDHQCAELTGVTVICIREFLEVYTLVNKCVLLRPAVMCFTRMYNNNIIIIGIYIAPFPFIKYSKALHIVIV